MKTFTKNNQEFICKNCGVKVPKHPTSSRDHCNNCLYSMHVDIYPGDRINECEGLLIPIGLHINGGKKTIVYRCSKCNKISKCITAPDDNFDKILEISKLKYVE